MPEGLIIQQHYAIAFKTEQKDSHCNSVKRARGAHFGRLSKTVPRVLAAMPIVG